MRIAVVDKDKCHPEKCGMICISSCPGVKLGKETIKILIILVEHSKITERGDNHDLHSSN